MSAVYAARAALRVALVRIVRALLPERIAFRLLGIPGGPASLDALEEIPVHDAACYFIPPPRTVEDSPHEAFQPGVDIDHSASGWVFERSFVVRVPGGVSRSTGFSFTDSGRLIELGKGLTPREPGTWDRWYRPFSPPRHFDGSVATLTTFWDSNYFHWLFDVLPRLRLLELAGLRPQWIYTPIRHAYQRDALLQLGCEPGRLVNSAEVPHVSAKELMLPSLPGIPGVMHKWVCAFLRERLAPPPPPGTPRQRIYVSRASARSRRVANEPQVLELLAAYGFKVVRPETMTLREQIRLFQSAECVVAPHGAALSNIVFCRPGTPVIEILPPQRMILCYWILSQQASLRYYYLLASPDSPGQDIELDREKLERTLDMALERPQEYAVRHARGASA